MIVDVHAPTPTHRDADQALTCTNWRSERPVVTTNSWADYDTAMVAADVASVFNIAVADPLEATGLDHRPEDTNSSTAAFCADAPSRSIGFMSVDPRAPGVLDDIERRREESLLYAAEWGAAGKLLQIIHADGPGALGLTRPRG